MPRLADAIVAIAEAALALGPDLHALEINPLAVTENGAEAMDALALWAPSGVPPNEGP
jgi:succinyl-CoA synthetase beta subunit